MTDHTDDDNATGGDAAGAGGRKPLTLKRPAAGGASVVKQSFSHGRTKTVVVETKRRAAPGSAPAPHIPAAPLISHPRPNAAAPRPTAPAPSARRGVDDPRLSDGEMQARNRALEAARAVEDDRRRQTAAAATEQARLEAEARAVAPPPPEAPAAPVVTPDPVAPAAPSAAEAASSTPAPAPAHTPMSGGPRSGGIQIGRFTNRPGAQAKPQQPATGDRRPGQGEGQRSASPTDGRHDVYRAPQGSSAGAATPREGSPRDGQPRYDGPRSAGIRLSRPPAGAAPRTPRPIGAGAPPAAPDVSKPGAASRGGPLPARRGSAQEELERSKAAKAPARGKGEPKRREGRLTITAALGDFDEGDRGRSLASVRRAREREKEKRARMLGGMDQVKVSREVVIPEALTIQDLAGRMATRAVDVIKYLMKQGTMAQINDVIDADTAELIAVEFGHSVKRVADSDVEEGFLGTDDDGGALISRPPVVTIMGHVDHGKTSLLDALRHTDVVAGEAGGITQHIGAYQVRLKDGQRVTFLDTPGHAAFSAMRMRGAQATDIVILVVAADDGVMPQTIEAISHAKAAGAPIVVAINKIDKPDANPQRVITDLLSYEIVTESMGGEVQAIEVSAKQRLGLEELIDAVLVQAEILDLKANPDRPAEGVVIESKIDKGRGPVATVLVKRGSLKRGDIVVAGSQWGRVRALVDERAAQLDTAGPSLPVEILGLDGAPEPG